MITICKLIITPIILTAMTIESNKHCGGARRIARLRASVATPHRAQTVMAHVSPSLVHSLHFEDISHHCTVKSLVCVVFGADLREPGLEWYVVLNVIFF